MSVGHFYFLLGLAALALLALLLAVVRRWGRRHRLPFVVEQTLFSPAQQAFLPVLERALGRGYRVYGKVRAADILRVRPRTNRRARRRALARLGERHFDFLACAADTGVIACAVNLSARSRLGRRPPRDGLDRLCAALGLPFVRFREVDRYSVVEIEEQVFGAMHALRLRGKGSEPHGEETMAALEDLSAVISDDQNTEAGVKSPSRLRPRPVKVEPSAPGDRTDPRIQPARPARAEPLLAPVHAEGTDIDEGPRFRIGGDLDLGERPVRLGKA